MASRILCTLVALLVTAASTFTHAAEKPEAQIRQTLRKQVLKQAAIDLKALPITVTAAKASRSAGGIHDFYSEGDYWWSDPQDPDGPYIQRDGQTNPDNFVAHRHAMVRFSMIVGNLTSAYLLTGNKLYAEAVMKHVRAWFVDEATRMNPNLLYAQAIKGIATGRGIGIIDTIHLIEVAQSLLRLEEARAVTSVDLSAVRQWFADYLEWISTHPYGIKEMEATNNHGTCWAMQTAMFAKFTGNKERMTFCADRYKQIFLPQQMAADGSFPRETARTKPYGYSLFNLDAMATLCEILSTPQDNLWTYTTSEGKNMQKGIDYLYPYVTDKENWPFPHDVMYWEQWPVAHPFLLFAALHLPDKGYLATWKQLEHFPTNDEVLRNLPIRNPIIWIKNN